MTYEIWIHPPLTSVGVVHSTWPSLAKWHMHASTFNNWHQKKRKTLHGLTHGAMQGCGLISLVVCISGKSPWYMKEKCDSNEWDLNYKHPFRRVGILKSEWYYGGWNYGVKGVQELWICIFIKFFTYLPTYPPVIGICGSSTRGVHGLKCNRYLNFPWTGHLHLSPHIPAYIPVTYIPAHDWDAWLEKLHKILYLVSYDI